jgi:hypothetical protein
MSSPLAIASVTAALKSLIDTGLTAFDLSSIGSYSVTALPPDRVETGQTEPNQVNLFLYQVTPNLGWRNAGLPATDGNGARAGGTPLALDLHYLLTAYGSKDTNAEVLLGFAMFLLHENPVLTRAYLRSVLVPSPWGASLPAVDLADQIELVKLTPAFLSTEDLSKMWTAMQARYRTTMAYMASVVLIQPGPGGKVAPPVLKQGPLDRGPVAVGAPGPSLASAHAAASESLPAVRLGDDVVLAGANLLKSGDPSATQASFEHAQTRIVTTVPVAAGPSPSTLIAHIPSIAEDADAMHEWVPGLYTVTLHTALPEGPQWTTNAVPVALSPIVDVSPLNAGPGDINLTVHCTPRIRPDQEPLVTLIFGSEQVLPAAITTPPGDQQPTELSFALKAVPKGEYLVRLRVNGIDSLPVTMSGTPPQLAFDPSQKVTVA